jgi:hypothetical protein
MGLPNLASGAASTVAPPDNRRRPQHSLSLPLRSGIFQEARLRAGHFSAAVERLRMAYGERGSSVDPATLQEDFQRRPAGATRPHHARSGRKSAEPSLHATINDAYAEMWGIFARPDPRWTAEDDKRLKDAGWSQEKRLLVADLREENRNRPLISQGQLKAHEERFGFAPTSSNLNPIKRVICSAREAGCREATLRVERQDVDMSEWAKDALADEGPLGFDDVAGVSPARKPSASPVSPMPQGQPAPAKTPAHSPQAAPVSEAPAPPPSSQPGEPEPSTKPKKLLRDAADECTKRHVRKRSWSPDSGRAGADSHSAVRLCRWG